MKINKGITLIALIITIIILLILAGVSINLIVGADGIISKAKEAAESYKGAQENELGMLADYENKLKDEIENPQTPGGPTLVDGTYTDVDGKEAKVPDGFVPSETPGETKIDDGLVVKAPDGSEFVWIPVPNPILDVQGKNDADINTAINVEIEAERYPMAIKVNSTDYKGILYNFSDTNNLTITKITYSSSGTGNREPAALSGESGYGITQSLLQTEYNAMVNSVIQNGGFYIGRYETSIRTESTVQSKANVSPMTAATGNLWWGIYEKQKAYTTNNTISVVTSGMIWGSQWDQIMLWMKNVPNTEISKPFYILDSTGKGWYYDNSDSSSKNTGVLASGKVKNIYDIAGNLSEWTMEAQTTGIRTIRRRKL